MRRFWKLTLFLFCTRLQYHVLLSKKMNSYFTLVTNPGKVTTIIPWRTESMFPPLLLDPKMVKIFSSSLTQSKTKEGIWNTEDLPEKFRDTSIVVRIAPCGEDKVGITESVTWERGWADPWRTQCISYQCRGTTAALKNPGVSRIPTYGCWAWHRTSCSPAFLE